MRPLDRGQSAVAVSLGGPLINTLGAVFPTPVLNLAGAHGLAERLTLTGAVDVTAALYGIVHVEPGVVFFPAPVSHGGTPAVAVTASTHVLANRHDLFLAPQLGGIASWMLTPHFIAYTGAEAAWAVAPGGDRSSRFIAGPLVGFEGTSGRVRCGLEVKWLAPWYDTGPAAPAWVSPGQRGYLSVLLGFGVRFGGGAP